MVYGDDMGNEVGKLVWSALAAADVKLVNTNDIQDVINHADDSLFNVIVLNNDPEAVAEIAARLAAHTDFIGDLAAIPSIGETDDRMRLLAMGFDLVFTRQILTQDVFKEILARKIERAKSRQMNLIMQEEYLRFRAALSASPDAFIVLDDQRRIFFVSEHYKRAYKNVGEKLVRGMPVEEAFEIASVEQGIFEDYPDFQKLKAFWQELKGIVEFTLPNGRTWRIKAAPLSDGQGTIVTTSDVTELLAQRKELEVKTAQLAEALENEKEASSLQKQFIGMVSHEFRTPLAIVDGHLQMIMRQTKPDFDQIKDRCRSIRGAVSRLVHMMESVLSSNLLKTGRMDPDPTLFDLSALVSELCEEQTVLYKPDTVTCDVSGLQGPVKLDLKMMTLILTNLISNAVKFSGDVPKVVVRAAQDGDQVILSVSDNGVGIPEEECKKIFDRYYRASTSAGVPGTGIGLDLVHSLVSIQNGRIEVESVIGEGTTFTIYLQNIN